MEETKHADGSTTYTLGERSVRTGKIQHTFYNDRPCYLVYLRGDVGFYFGDDDGGILHTEDYEGGTNVWYVPQDANFEEYSSSLIRLGEWGA